MHSAGMLPSEHLTAQHTRPQQMPAVCTARTPFLRTVGMHQMMYMHATPCRCAPPPSKLLLDRCAPPQSMQVYQNGGCAPSQSKHRWEPPGVLPHPQTRTQRRWQAGLWLGRPSWHRKAPPAASVVRHKGRRFGVTRPQQHSTMRPAGSRETNK